MMKILRESYQDVEVFLRSTTLVNQIIDNFGRQELLNPTSSLDISNYVASATREQFDSEVFVDKVIVCKVIGDDIEFVDQNHYVVLFNGYYYDYGALAYTTSFNNLIQISALPVVQKVVNSDEQITDKLSTVKGYTLLGY